MNSVRVTTHSTIKLRLMAGTAAMGLALCAMPAIAQEASADNADDSEIVVSGIRYSLSSAADLKRNNEGVTESIVAEDLGKLPDLSVAESLARLPGVAAQRIDGRAQDISIRGMGPQFSVTLFNGNEMVSTGDDRSFQYDQLPAELVSSMTIYKTSDVTLSSQGLAGTVDIRSVRPLDVNGRKIAINLRGEANGYGKLVPGISNHGERISASYINQFADGKFGIALGYSHLGSPVEKKYFNPWDFGKADDLWVAHNAAFDPVPGNPWMVSGFETGNQSIKTSRDTFLAVLDYKSDTFRSTLNYLHSDFRQHMRGTEVLGVTAGWSPGTLPWVSVPTGPDLAVHVDNGTLGMTFRGNDRKDKINLVDWNNRLEMGDWTLGFDLSWSRADREEKVAEGYASNRDPVSYTVTFPSDFNSFGSLAVTGLNFADPSKFWLSTFWWGGGAYQGVADVSDETKSGKLSLRREWEGSALSSLDLGLVYSERSKALAFLGSDYDLVGAAGCIMGGCLAVPSAQVAGTSPMNFNGLGGAFHMDIMSALTNSSLYTKSFTGRPNPTWNWSTKEKVFTGYAKLGLAFDALIPWKGSLGVQVVSVDQTGYGLNVDDAGTRTSASGNAKYTDILPALMLTGSLGDNTKLRLGLSRAAARPNMASMRGGMTAAVGSDLRWSGSGGNPALKPWLSTDIDVSLEHYFAKGSYIALAFFDKEVSRAIVTKDVSHDFTGFNNPSPFIPTSNIGTLSTPTNVKGGYVRGLEFSLTLDAGQLIPALDGFGFTGSYAYADSNLPGTNSDGSVNLNNTLEGLSHDVANATVYYEKAGFEFRVGTRYRSGYTATRHNAFRFVMDTIRPELVTDVQAGYTFQGGPLKGLGVLFEVNNITDEPYVVTQTAEGQTVIKEFHKYGRQFLLGFNYKF